ncbi:MAG: hypothetical protein QMD21_02195 [Candidatus Thermoplasmatota archaeon]|nr:hypothetical protein [Candidatus Thermoplasmatota archaeon]MDI6855582.1 hypothetical protein [Candidatus Thermoplasmatota archaeon]MDI6887466.1 hypothetical protein [Candidatus Thermoplasmatota archaeon]
MIRLPSSFSAQTLAPLLRESLEELKFKFEREQIQKHYTQIMVLVPLPKFAYTFRFVIKEPSEFIIDLYDAKITHSGMVHFIELENVRRENIANIRLVLSNLTTKLPRKPWEFTLAQKFQIGFLAPEIITARSKWRKLGIE